jgi:hypothetical protein
MKSITAATSIRTGAKESYSQGQERKSSSAQKQQMQCLCGAGLSTEAESAVSTAPYSETKAPSDPQNLYAKRIKLLIESGLVAGITPTSVRQRSDQQTLDFVSSKPVGND